MREHPVDGGRSDGGDRARPSRYLERFTSDGRPFALRAVTLRGLECHTYARAPATLGDLFARARLFKGREFLVAGQTRLGFDRVLAWSERIGAHLTNLGGEATTVGLVVADPPTWVAAFMAATSSGARVALIDALEPGKVLARLAQTGSQVVLADRAIAGLLLPAYRNAGTVDSLAVMTRCAAGSQPGAADRAPASAGDEALVVYTSGTTGEPKPIVQTHLGIITGLMNMVLGGALGAARQPTGPAAQAAGGRAAPATVLLAPLTHVTGYTQVLLSLFTCSRLILPVAASPGALCDLVQREHATNLAGAPPALLRAMLRHPQAPSKLASLAGVFVHGSAIDRRMREEVVRVTPGARLCTSYGLSETNGAIATAVGADLTDRPGVAGFLAPTARVRIVDGRGRDAPLGDVGEIWVGGAMMMARYLEDPATSCEWLKTGDVGWRDADGFLYVLHRKKHVLRLDGRAVALERLEQAAAATPGVDEAAAWRLGAAAPPQRIGLAIVAWRGLDDEVRAELRRAIGGCGVRPERVLITAVDNIPRTRSGKVDRNRLALRLPGPTDSTPGTVSGARVDP